MDKVVKFASCLLLVGAMIASPAYAGLLFLKCPAQEYSVTGKENNYFFISGKGSVTWENKTTSIAVRGRFLNPGEPKSLAMTTLSVDVDTYDEKRGIRFNCNLADESTSKVAFAYNSFLLSDIGIHGQVESCTQYGSISACEVSS